MGQCVNSLFLGDGIWCNGWSSTLVHFRQSLMACHLVAPSHYPNLCWLINTSKVLWCSLFKEYLTTEMDVMDEWDFSRCQAYHMAPQSHLTVRNQYVVRLTALVFTGAGEACHQCLLWRPQGPGRSPWQPFCFSAWVEKEDNSHDR